MYHTAGQEVKQATSVRCFVSCRLGGKKRKSLFCLLTQYVDCGTIAHERRDFLQQFDHSLCVNTDDPNYAAFVAAYGERIIPFDREDPTSEVMARTIFNFARHALEKAREGCGEYPVRNCVTLERVRVWETSSSWAEYGE